MFEVERVCLKCWSSPASKLILFKYNFRNSFWILRRWWPFDGTLKIQNEPNSNIETTNSIWAVSGDVTVAAYSYYTRITQ